MHDNFLLSKTLFPCLLSPAVVLKLLFLLLLGFRLEEKQSNLESENQVLRQQALAISPTSKSLAARQKTTVLQVFDPGILSFGGTSFFSIIIFLLQQRIPDNGAVLNGETKAAPVSWIVLNDICS